MVGDSRLPPVGVPSRCPRRPAWAAAQQYPLLLPGADPLKPGSGGAEVSSLKRDLPFSSSRGGKKTASGVPGVFTHLPAAQHLNFAEHPSIMHLAGLPEKSIKDSRTLRALSPLHAGPPGHAASGAAWTPPSPLLPGLGQPVPSAEGHCWETEHTKGRASCLCLVLVCSALGCLPKAREGDWGPTRRALGEEEPQD